MKHNHLYCSKFNTYVLQRKHFTDDRSNPFGHIYQNKAHSLGTFSLEVSIIRYYLPNLIHLLNYTARHPELYLAPVSHTQSRKVKPQTDIACVFANKYASRGNLIWRAVVEETLDEYFFRKYTLQLNKV